ncbi:MAG TPA: phosphoribosylformylglycinamidine synthase, partial [Candidatus Omnitrophica bacterium]|nr:phosphoribosylformylglycinamidine synthase [Candidatus Omnitrophota bacterium]
VSKNNLKKLLKVFESEDVEATVIGKFTNDKILRLFYYDKKVCELGMDFLHEGIPLYKKKAVVLKPKLKEPRIKPGKDLTPTLKKVLSDYNVASKEWVIRQYDHEVQGGSVLKPLVGVNNDGPSDASVVRPILSSNKGLIVSCGINPRYGEISAYWMAATCIDEALRQIICVGGSIKRTAILDNFCWGNPDNPDRLGSLVSSAYACYDFSKYFGVPFISGKDSLNNEYRVDGKSISIPGTLLISAISVMDDVTKVISMDFKKPGNLIYIVGETKNELGGSIYYKTKNSLGVDVPRVDKNKAKNILEKLSSATDRSLVRSMHDCSEGGMAVALSEMCFAGGLGADIFLAEAPYKTKNEKRNDYVLFSESNSRFVVEVERKNKEKFESILKGLPFGMIGCVSNTDILTVFGLDAKFCVKADINQLKESWQAPLNW